VEREEWKFDTLCDLYDTLTITQVRGGGSFAWAACAPSAEVGEGAVWCGAGRRAGDLYDTV
jgi:hypothetical protein